MNPLWISASFTKTPTTGVLAQSFFLGWGCKVEAATPVDTISWARCCLPALASFPGSPFVHPGCWVSLLEMPHPYGILRSCLHVAVQANCWISKENSVICIPLAHPYPLWRLIMTCTWNRCKFRQCAIWPTVMHTSNLKTCQQFYSNPTFLQLSWMLSAVPACERAQS